jgi:hypothetical protein
MIGGFKLQVERYRKDGHAYDGRPVSRWSGPPEEKRAVFVDETRCQSLPTARWAPSVCMVIMP